MTFDPNADIIDLRDVIEAAVEEMEDEAAELVSVAGETDEGEASTEARAFLGAMASDLGWPYGRDESENRDAEIIETAREHDEPTIIARSYFVEYAEDLASDIGAIGSESREWPLYCIDWERAARDLEADYSTFTYDGNEYLIRST